MNDKQRDNWHRVVSPALAKLAQSLQDQDRSQDIASYRFAGGEIKLSAREHKLVSTANQHGGLVLSPRLELIRDCAGLRAKIHWDLNQLDSVTTHQEAKAILDELKSDEVIGTRMAYELRSETNELAQSGQMDESMKVDACRRRLNAAVDLARNLAETEPEAHLPQNAAGSKSSRSPKRHDSARSSIDDLVAKTTAASEIGIGGSQCQTGNLSEADLHELEKREQFKKKLAIALVALFFVVATAVTISLTHMPTLPTFSVTDFDAIPEVTNVVVRPPEILIIVDESGWMALSQEEKKRALATVVETVEAAGYRRVEFRSQQRAGLASWTEKGIKIPN